VSAARSEPARICGTAAVAALFAVRPATILRLFFTEARRADALPICAALAKARRPYREVPPEELARIAGTPHHGGICAIAIPRVLPTLPWPPPATLLATPLLPVLHAIGNPHNLGAIARSAAFFGCGAMLLSPDPRGAGLSDSAHRVAEGGLDRLDLFRATGWPDTLRGLARTHLTVAAVAEGGDSPEAIARDRPIALVLGNEEEGLDRATVLACTARVTLVRRGAVQSLNVAQAAAVLIHALLPPDGLRNPPRPRK
jgi:TrmH RNA methyltransferase